MSFEDSLAPSKCFICDFTGHLPEEVFTHASEKHGLDMLKVLSTSGGAIDQLDYVKLVNFLRKNGGVVLSPEEWKDDRYLIPVLQNDPLLYFDVEVFSESRGDLKSESAQQVLKQKLEATESELLEARATIETMKVSVHKWLGENVTSGNGPLKIQQELAFTEEGDIDGDEEVEEDNDEQAIGSLNSQVKKMGRTSGQCRNGNVSSRSNGAVDKVAPVDWSYFCSYAGYSVHKDMLQDRARTLAYLNFIKQNRALFENKVVIDVGCGTGVLSMFAVRYGGARKVFAIEPSHMAFQAIDTIAENGMNPDSITVVNAPIESSEAAKVLTDFGEKADIIVSEWMGYFMIFENMLPSVMFARDKFMKPNGFMAPSKATLFLDATDSVAAYNEFVGFWGDVYGFTMHKMRRRILMDAQLYVFEQNDIVSSMPSTVMALNLNECPPPPAHFSTKFDMKFSKSTKITAFVGWFTVDFEGGSENTCLSTAPGLLKTHWQQTALFLPEPIPVEPNESYPCSVSINRCDNDHRSLMIGLTFKERTFRWALCRD